MAVQNDYRTINHIFLMATAFLGTKTDDRCNSSSASIVENGIYVEVIYILYKKILVINYYLLYIHT